MIILYKQKGIYCTNYTYIKNTTRFYFLKKSKIKFLRSNVEMRTFKLLSNILIDTIVQLLLHKITNRIPEHQRIDNTLAGGRAPRWRCRHLLLGDNGVPLGVPTGFTKSVKGVTQHVVTIWSHWVQLATLSPTSATSVSVMLSPTHSLLFIPNLQTVRVMDSSQNGTVSVTTWTGTASEQKKA